MSDEELLILSLWCEVCDWLVTWSTGIYICDPIASCHSCSYFRWVCQQVRFCRFSYFYYRFPRYSCRFLSFSCWFLRYSCRFLSFSCRFPRFSCMSVEKLLVLYLWCPACDWLITWSTSSYIWSPVLPGLQGVVSNQPSIRVKILCSCFHGFLEDCSWFGSFWT